MPTNAQLAGLFSQMAQMMDLLGEDSFRAAAHARAARTLEDLAEEVAGLPRERLIKLEGIGAKIADKIVESTATGTIAEHAELAARLPAGLLQLLLIPGLGPKTVRAMWQEGGITDVASLKKAIDSGELLKLPRMGAKAVAKIKDNLALLSEANKRTWLGKASTLAQSIVQHLRALPGVARVEAAGSLRRGKETVGDIDILVGINVAQADFESTQKRVAETFRQLPGITQILVAGDNKSSVRMTMGSDIGRWSGIDEEGPSGIQVDLRVLPVAVFGAALQYFTGSKEHNVKLRERALKQGLTLNEWGLFPEDDEPTPPQTRGVQPVAAGSEEEIYRKLGLPFIPPEIREDRGEFDSAELPRLVELQDIKAELHAHTTASDGRLSIEELAREAKARGFHTIAVTDHSRSSAIANGLSIERLLAHIEAVHKAREIVQGIQILAGSEVDILADGSLDYPDHILRQLDIVVASPHTALGQDPDTSTARLLAAIRHPLVHIIGHPTGRLINKRAGMSPNMTTLIEAAIEHRVALEINSHWLRLDLRDAHVRLAVSRGCTIAINCDVHERQDFDNLHFGVTTGRRGWLTPELCVNTWTSQKLSQWLRSKGRE